MSEMVSVVKRIYLSLSVCLFVHLCECLSLPLSQTRKQTVVLNEQNSSWANVEAGVSQGFILGPLLFLIYINDLPDNLSTNVKLFSDNTSLFSVVGDIATSSCDLNHNLDEGLPENSSRSWGYNL